MSCLHIFTGNKWKIIYGDECSKHWKITNADILLIGKHNREREIKYLKYNTIIISFQTVDFEGWGWNE
jgi:hypothetical protein